MIRYENLIPEGIPNVRLQDLAQLLAASPKRVFPWRATSNPYYILVAELLLQRTLPNHVKAVFPDFIANYPNICTLDSASAEDLAELVFPLGFKKRVDLIRNAAAFICNELKGQFPRLYSDWLCVPSVGPYTAAAIISMSYGDSVAMVDVNTARILCRYLGIEPRVSNGDSIQKDRRLVGLADKVVEQDPIRVRDINFGFLDVGALHCKSTPKCFHCPLRSNCLYGKTTISSPS